MPVEHYFKGHGREVMANMKKEYGEKKGKSIFYATANKRGMGGIKGKMKHKKNNKRSMFSKGRND